MDKSFPTENGCVDCPKTTTAQLGHILVYEVPLLAIDALGGRRAHNMFDSLVSLFYRDQKNRFEDSCGKLGASNAPG